MYRSVLTYTEAVEVFKKAIIENALKENRGNQIKAAQQLGMHRNSLSRLVAELQLDARQFRVPSRRRSQTESDSAPNKASR